MLNVRYPAQEVEALDEVAAAKGMSRGHFIYVAVSREVSREQRRQGRAAERRSA